MQLLFTISVAILSSAQGCVDAPVPSCADTDNPCCTEPPCVDGAPGSGLSCDKSKFIDHDGCDLFQQHFFCMTTSSKNNNKCVRYEHDGRNCPHDGDTSTTPGSTEGIPQCQQLDFIAAWGRDAGDDINISYDENTGQPYASQQGKYAGQGMTGWHFCQRSNMCYHPQAATSGASALDSDGNTRPTLPTPADAPTAVTDRCDDYDGPAKPNIPGLNNGQTDVNERDTKAGDKGNWRDHIFEVADHSNFKSADCWITSSCPNAWKCKDDVWKTGHDGVTSESCKIFALPKSNSFQSTSQCAHGKAWDNCNGVTFYFHVADRGHNFNFNFCRHNAPGIAHVDGDWNPNNVASDVAHDNQWVDR